MDQEPLDGEAALNVLAWPREQVQPEHSGVSGRHLVTVVSTLPSDWLVVRTLRDGLWWILASNGVTNICVFLREGPFRKVATGWKQTK